MARKPRFGSKAPRRDGRSSYSKFVDALNRRGDPAELTVYPQGKQPPGSFNAGAGPARAPASAAASGFKRLGEINNKWWARDPSVNLGSESDRINQIAASIRQRANTAPIHGSFRPPARGLEQMVSTEIEALRRKLSAEAQAASATLTKSDPYSKNLEDLEPHKAPTQRSKKRANSPVTRFDSSTEGRSTGTTDGRKVNPNVNKRRAKSTLDAIFAPAKADFYSSDDRLGVASGIKSGRSSVLSSEGFGKGIAKEGVFSKGSSQVRSFLNNFRNPTAFLNRSLVFFAANKAIQGINDYVKSRGVGPMDTPEQAYKKMYESPYTYLMNNPITQMSKKSLTSMVSFTADALAATSSLAAGPLGYGSFALTPFKLIPGFNEGLAQLSGQLIAEAEGFRSGKMGWHVGAFEDWMRRDVEDDTRKAAYNSRMARNAGLEAAGDELDQWLLRNAKQLMLRGISNIPKYREMLRASPQFLAFSEDYVMRQKEKNSAQFLSTIVLQKDSEN